jgi:chromosome segregation ATPase
MGWGISIDQDEDGYVCCADANFETGIEDYEGLPPSSYGFIRNYMEDNYHREIDMARDEGSVQMAFEACDDAFRAAKRAYERLSRDEKLELHLAWFETHPHVELRDLTDAEICLAKCRDEYGEDIQRLERAIKELQDHLAKFARPLRDLEEAHAHLTTARDQQEREIEYLKY